MRMRAAIGLLFVALLAAAAGCRYGESCAERLARLKAYRVEAGRDEKAALAAVDRKRTAYDERLAAREKDVKAKFAAYRRSVVAPAAERYHALLADARATDPASAPKMNPRIEAAATDFREAERRTEAEVGPKERGALERLAAKRRFIHERLDAERACIARHFAGVREELDYEIAIEQRYVGRRN